MAGFGELIGGLLGGALGVIGGAPGVAIGGALGSGLGGKIGDWISGDDAPAKPAATQQTQTAGLAPTGLPPWMSGGAGAIGSAQNPFAQPGGFGGGSSGGGGAGVSFAPGLPADPGGGLAGPIYGTQGLPAAAQAALSGILAALRAYPYISDILQRRWDFPTETEVLAPKSQALWTAVARQLPKDNREALEQFLVGFPTTIGLTKSAQDVFLTLKIAESGYTPEQLCCVAGVK